MNTLQAQIESILFITVRPVSIHKLAKILDVDEKSVREAVAELKEFRNGPASGIHVVESEGAVELATNPAFADILSSMSKEETQSELTRPQLETLTIIAYRGPITKPEIEHIRGVNCSLILRNLLMRGLIIERDDPSKMLPAYVLSTEMLRGLGLHGVDELPDYQTLHHNAKIDQLLEAIAGQEE